MAGYEILRVYEDGLYDFKPYLMNNVFEQLIQIDDFEEQLVICMGAVADGVPVGALAAQLLTGNEVFLYSIVVNPKYQKTGIGRELIYGVLKEACNVFSAEYSIPSMPFRVFVHTDYALPQEDLIAFEAFLQHVGFQDFHEMESVCCIHGNKIRSQWFEPPAPCPGVKISSFAEEAGEYADEVSAFLMNQGYSLSADHGFMAAEGDPTKAEQVKGALIAEYGLENEYNLMAFGTDDQDLPDELYLALLKNILISLRNETPDFLLIADGHTNINMQILEELTAEAGTRYIHKEAGFYCEFNTVIE